MNDGSSARPDVPWDFSAEMDGLLARQGSADGWRRWDELREAAEGLVERARASDVGQLHRWLDEQAVLLVGQQLLVRSVHREREPRPEMEQVLRAWRRQAGERGSTADAVTWLQREEPALLRAWMLDHLTELVDRELTGLRRSDGVDPTDHA